MTRQRVCPGPSIIEFQETAAGVGPGRRFVVLPSWYRRVCPGASRPGKRSGSQPVQPRHPFECVQPVRIRLGMKWRAAAKEANPLGWQDVLGGRWVKILQVKHSGIRNENFLRIYKFYNIVSLLTSGISIMSTSLSPNHVSQQAEAIALGSRLEVATEALLRAKDQVVAALDRQVLELQQLHRALAYAPIPVIVPEDPPAPPRNGAPAIGLFEHAPKVPVAPPPLPKPAIPPPRVAPPAPTNLETPLPSAVAVPGPHPAPIEAPLDPTLERATLEELNEALASAFASVSSRHHARC